MAGHIISPRIYYSIFTALLLLLALTIGVSYIHLGYLNVVAAMTIAVTKAALIILYFMHVRYSSRLTWVFVSAGFFWLGILLLLSMTDFLTRGWLPLPPGWE
jgi:cytochrome c oxidase subunit 4